MKTTYQCNQCGSESIEIASWIKANTNKYVSDVTPQSVWCPECKEYVSLETVKENE